jgi:hypothetical protein
MQNCMNVNNEIRNSGFYNPSGRHLREEHWVAAPHSRLATTATTAKGKAKPLGCRAPPRFSRG